MPLLSKQEHPRPEYSSQQPLRAPDDRAGSGPVQPANTKLITLLNLPFLFLTPPKKKYDFFCHSRMPDMSDGRRTSRGEQSRGPAVEKRDRRGVTPAGVRSGAWAAGYRLSAVMKSMRS